MTSVTLEKFIYGTYLSFYESKHPKDRYAELKRIGILLTCAIAKKALGAVTKNDVVAFLAELEHKRKLKKATLNRYRARLYAIFAYAYDEGYINTNPVKGIKKYKEYCRTRFLSCGEIEYLFEECQHSRNKELYTIVVLALNTGMRKNEILTLERSDISLSQRRLILRQALTKSGQSREVYLNDAALKALEAHLSAANPQGKIFKSECVRVAFERALKRAKIELFRFHDLRRTFATHLKDRNVPIHTISSLLGHSEIAMTERYLARSDAVLLESVSKLEFGL